MRSARHPRRRRTLIDSSSFLHIRGGGRIIGYQIESSSQPGTGHSVTPTSCDCKGFAYRNYCKHEEAVDAYVASQRPRPEPMAADEVLKALGRVLRDRRSRRGVISAAEIERED